MAHLYRPGLDGRPTYAHGEENPLQSAESVGRGVYIHAGGKVVDHKFYNIKKHSQDQNDLQLVRRHFLDQPLEFPFGQPDQLFDQPASSQSDVGEGLDYLEGDYHPFAPSSLEQEHAEREPEYFDPLILDYYDEGSAMDYDVNNLQEKAIEHQKVQNNEQALDQNQMLGEFLEMFNETAPEGREELYGPAQLRQAGFLPLESKEKEPEEEVKC